MWKISHEKKGEGYSELAPVLMGVASPQCMAHLAHSHERGENGIT